MQIEITSPEVVSTDNYSPTSNPHTFVHADGTILVVGPDQAVKIRPAG